MQKAIRQTFELEEKDVLTIGNTEHYIWEILDHSTDRTLTILTLVNRHAYDNDYPSRTMQLHVEQCEWFTVYRK